MKIYIGPYLKWIGPYQIADFFVKPLFGPDRAHEFGGWLADKTPIGKLCQWIEEKKKRTVRVKIHPYDTWNMESTLAVIVLPMLKQLKATKHGSPFTSNEDVPENLHTGPTLEDDHIDANHHARWEWILDQMIWSFEQLQPDCDWEAQFYSGESDILFERTADNMYQMVRGDKDTFKYDSEGAKEYSARIDLGLKFFGRYYRCLWD